jgi:hypothetical protein
LVASTHKSEGGRDETLDEGEQTLAGGGIAEAVLYASLQEA